MNKNEFIDISNSFNMEDIRRIRDNNSLCHIKMTPAEIIADINVGANEMLKKLSERKKQDKNIKNN